MVFSHHERSLKIIGERAKSLQSLTVSGPSILEWATGYNHIFKKLGNSLKFVSLTHWDDIDYDDYDSDCINSFFKSLSENCQELRCLVIGPIQSILPENIRVNGFQRLTKLEIQYR